MKLSQMFIDIDSSDGLMININYNITIQYTLGSLVVLPPGLLHAGSLRPVLPGQALAAPLLRLVEALINDVSKGS